MCNNHYFCVLCFSRLHDQFPVTPLHLEEFLNLAFRDVCVFQLGRAENIFSAYGFVKRYIPDIKPLPNLAEYILLYKLIYLEATARFRNRAPAFWEACD